jgi:succinyl-CoA synthetase alpha subunit
MSILVNKDSGSSFKASRASSARCHAKACMAYGTQVVAGVTPGRGGQLSRTRSRSSTPSSAP